MPAQKLEIVHRQALSAFNHRRITDAMYYRDVILDPEIEQLVQILNNEWAITIFARNGQAPRIYLTICRTTFFIEFLSPQTDY